MKAFNIRLTLLRYFLLFLASLVIANNLNAQEEEPSAINGNLESNANFFLRDSAIGASNTPQYDRQLFGTDTWLNISYTKGTLNIGARFDMFNNSNLINRLGSYSAQGIGRWYIQKKFDKLNITAGYIYDQIGNGIIFRAFEERPLAIDNALYGLKVGYEIAPNLNVKVLAGKQKQQFNTYESNMRGANLDYFYQKDSSELSIAPGIGVLARTYDDNTINQLVSSVSTYSKTDSVPINYNTYAMTAYNKLNYKEFSWSTEFAYKTKDIFFDAEADKTNLNGEISKGKFVSKTGTIIYNSLTYSGTKFSVSLEHKITRNFNYRINPFVEGNMGSITYLPPLTRQNTFRLTSRYSVAPRELNEDAAQIDVRYNFNEAMSININAAHINGNNISLYDEIYSELSYTKGNNQLEVGLQVQKYNQKIYENKVEASYVNTITPFIELTHEFSETKSLRTELQYLDTKEDYGSWLFALCEYSIAPSWTFTLSDMYNVKPKKTEALHYPVGAITYTKSASRFNLSYVKQVEGIVCSGGICRFEPAFSGFKFNIQTAF
jgi:Family of unknown function (DUF6029)